MTKKRIGLGLVAVLSAAGLLVACDNKGGDEPVGPEAKSVVSVQLKGIYDAYDIDDTIDWSKVTVVVKYSDNTSVTISTADIEFDVETAKNPNTKAIINTNGLHDLEALTEHDYEIKVALLDEDSKVFDAGLISVGDISPEKYTLMSFTKPDFVSKYEEAKANAGKTPGAEEQKIAESWFKKGDEIFTVGTLNTFKFVPTALFSRKNELSGVIKASNSYKKDVKLEVLVSGEYVAADAADYAVVKEGIKFNDSAASKQFKLTVKPQQFSVPNPSVIEFKVEKGLNIYSAKELGAINLTSTNPEDGKVLPYYENRYCPTEARGVDPIFPNEGNDGQVRKDSFVMWENFLKASGTFTEEEVNKYRDAPGYFLMNSVNVTSDDIPSEFFIKDGEYNNTNNIATGALRDSTLIYHVLPNVSRVINGNYCKVDATNVPLSMSTANGDGLKVITPSDKTVDPGHSCLFYASGKKYAKESDDNYMKGTEYTSGVNPVVFKNLNVIGNTGTDLGHTSFPEGSDDNFKKMAKLTGLIGIKGGALPFTIDNCLVKECMIGIFANTNLASYNGEAPSKLLNAKVFDCANSGTFNYQCQNFVVDNCELKRFGGSALFNVGHKDQVFRGGVTYVNSNTVIENKVTGEEVYFTAVGASGQIGTLKGINAFFSAPFAAAPFVDSDGFIDCISLTMEDGYMGSKEHVFYGKTVLNADLEGKTFIDLADSNNWGGQAYQTVESMLHTYAPVVAFDGSMKFNVPGLGEVTKAGNSAAGVLLFDENNPMSTDPVIPAEYAAFIPGAPYYAGVYVPVLSGSNLQCLAKTTAYTGSNMHLCVPAASTTLSLILGI